jgi:hypothetical protein
VFLTAGPVEPVDEAEVLRVRADGVLKKPFESSVLLAAVLKYAPRADRAPSPFVSGRARAVVVIDPDQIRAAVTVALDAAMPAMIDEISQKVIAALMRPGKKANA